MAKITKAIHFEIEASEQEVSDKETVKNLMSKAMDEGAELLRTHHEVVVVFKKNHPTSVQSSNES